MADRFPTEELLKVLTEAVELATSGGTTHPPRLLEEVVGDFELAAQSAFTKAETRVSTLLGHARAHAADGEGAVDEVLQQLERLFGSGYISSGRPRYARNRGAKRIV